MQAWTTYLTYSTNAKSFKRMAHVATYLLIFSILTTVIIATLDANIGQFMRWMGWNELGCPACPNKDIEQSVHCPICSCNSSTTPQFPQKCLNYCQTEDNLKGAFDALTVSMPLLSSFLLAMLHKFDPKLKWLSLKFAAAQIEAEIYKYRLRVGHYENVKVESKWWRMARSGQLKSAALQAAMRTMHDAHKGEARTKFGLQLKKIESDLMDGAMNTSALKFDQAARKEPPEKLGLKLAYPQGADRATNADYDSDDSDNEETAPSTPLDVEQNPTSSSGSKRKLKKDHGRAKGDTSNDGMLSAKSFTAGQTLVADNGISLMDVQVYVRCRLLVKLAALRDSMPKKERAFKFWQIMMYIFTIMGTALASYNNAQWVPAAAAFAAAIKSVNEYQSLEQGTYMVVTVCPIVCLNISDMLFRY
eukprot:COSAG01_NODE_1620_length_9713_cov_4.117433_3_plen_418_part_00